MEDVLTISNTDDGLIQQIRAGSNDAFEELVSTHQRLVRGFIVRHLGNLQEADELAQDVFVAAFRGIDRYQGTGSVTAWLLGIARHHVLTYFRNKKRAQPMSLECALDAIQLRSLDDDPFDIEAEELRLDALRSCIQLLEPVQQGVLTQFYYRSESAEDIGHRLNKPAGTVRMMLLRLRKSLRHCIAAKIDAGGSLR